MRIIISPAKKMIIDTDSLPYEALPQFLPQTETLHKQLKSLSHKQAKSLWACNDTIAKKQFELLHTLTLTHPLTPAILAYEGIQYKYMAPTVFSQTQLEYIQTHLRILSGFYGLLKPFDGVIPYRLEMQARLKGKGYHSLYEFWKDTLAKQLCEETTWVLNLASKEYSKAITHHLPHHFPVITCVFGELIDGKVVEKGTFCKMARGEMVRYLAENSITTQEGVQTFNRLGYQYHQALSSPTHFIFIKRGVE